MMRAGTKNNSRISLHGQLPIKRKSLLELKKTDVQTKHRNKFLIIPKLLILFRNIIPRQRNLVPVKQSKRYRANFARLPVSDKERTWRFCGVLVFLFLGSGIIVSRLYDLQCNSYHNWRELATRQQETIVRVQGARGSIVDTTGRPLAVSVNAVSIGAHPRQILDKQAFATRLSEQLDLPKQAIIQKLNSEKPFIWISRGLPHAHEAKLKNLNLDGLALVREFNRYYPQGSLAGSLLGRVGTDGYGLSGLELKFNEKLKAETRSLPVRRDARGRLVTVSETLGDQSSSSFGYFSTSKNSNLDYKGLFTRLSNRDSTNDIFIRDEGSALQLSIHAVMQGIFEEELLKGQKEAKARSSFGVLMDADTGEILALSEQPGFDPNAPEDLVDLSRLRNSIIQETFEPGSTLKPLVAAIALQEGVIRVRDSLDCENGTYRVGRHTIRDVHPEKLLSFPDVLIRSSNICMIKIGQRLGKPKLYQGLVDLGFGKQTGVEFNGEEQGIFRHLKNWAESDLATHSFGHGVSVTALQLTRAYAALANGGYLVQPTVLKRNALTRIPRERVIDEKASNTIAELLTGVTEDEHGTGKKAAIIGLKVAGKTGTAHKTQRGKKGYDAGRVLSSFIGFVDGSKIGVNRRLVMFVGIDEPGVKPRWGGVVAAPVYRRAMERVLLHLLTANGNDMQTAYREVRREPLG